MDRVQRIQLTRKPAPYKPAKPSDNLPPLATQQGAELTKLGATVGLAENADLVVGREPSPHGFLGDGRVRHRFSVACRGSPRHRGGRIPGSIEPVDLGLCRKLRQDLLQLLLKTADLEDELSQNHYFAGSRRHFGGSYDAFVAKLSPTGQHVWSTYLGGNDTDEGKGIAVDGSGNALVTCETRSSGWVSGGFDTSYNGGTYDAFVAKIRAWQPIGGGSSITGQGDLNGDGTDDVLLRNSLNGRVSTWIVHNGAFQRWSNIGVTNVATTNVAGVGDFDGDGTDDVLLYNFISGLIGTWIINDGAYQRWSSIGVLT